MDNIVTIRVSWVESESKSVRSVAFNTSMDPDFIRNSRSLDEAISHFRSYNPDIPTDFEFDYFEINKQRYTWDEIFLGWTVESSLLTRTDRSNS